MSRQPRTDLTPPKISDQPGRQGNDNHGNNVKPPSSLKEMVGRKVEQARAKYNNLTEEQQALLLNRALGNFPQLMMIILGLGERIDQTDDAVVAAALAIKGIKADIKGIKADLDGMARGIDGMARGRVKVSDQQTQMNMATMQALQSLQSRVIALEKGGNKSDIRGIKGDLDGMARGRRALEARIRSLEDRMQLLDNNAAEEAR